VASFYLLSGAFIPWLVLIYDPASLCKGYCLLVLSQYAATASSYWQYLQIPHSATPLDIIEVVASFLPLAAAIPALYFSIAISARSPAALVRWGYVCVLVGALIMALFAFLVVLLLPFPAPDWTTLVLSGAQLTAIVILAANLRSVRTSQPSLE
jgi:hypothetical protein